MPKREEGAEYTPGFKRGKPGTPSMASFGGLPRLFHVKHPELDILRARKGTLQPSPAHLEDPSFLSLARSSGKVGRPETPSLLTTISSEATIAPPTMR